MDPKQVEKYFTSTERCSQGLSVCEPSSTAWWLMPGSKGIIPTCKFWFCFTWKRPRQNNFLSHHQLPGQSPKFNCSERTVKKDKQRKKNAFLPPFPLNNQLMVIWLLPLFCHEICLIKFLLSCQTYYCIFYILNTVGGHSLVSQNSKPPWTQ